MPRSANHIGKRGESIAMAELLLPGPEGLPLFNPHFLGDKAEAIDLYVELLTPSGGEFFLAQIKTATKVEVVNGESRLPIRITADDYRKLAAYSVPVYLLGVNVDRLTPEIYLQGIEKTRQRGVSYLPATFPLNRETLAALFSEGHEFWANQNFPVRRSRFLP